MRAAIYARTSTEQLSVADDQKSVARQIEHARAYATGKGWSVSDEHTFVDDGISGAEFAGRPGFVRLMNALKPAPSFQVLVMSEESRLGREAIETAYALKQIITAGVRVFFYLENRERVLGSPSDKIMLSLTAFADELEREKARQRTYDAMARKARALHVTGGRCFGYRNVEVRTPDGRRAYVTREVDPREAAVVRRIFELWVTGVGLTSISKRLNEDGVPCPRAQRGRPQGWCSSSVRTILYRELYKGEVVWNRTQKRDTWGLVRPQGRPRQDWVRISAPDLRIIADELWTAAQLRLAFVRQRWWAGMKGRPFGSGAKYLLTGLLQCSECGSGIEARSRRHGARRVMFYGCSGYHRKGVTVCRNSLTLPMDVVDNAVMTTVEESLLRPDLVELALNKALDAVATEGTPSDRDRIVSELASVKAELARCVELAAAGGGEIPAVLAAIRQREQRRNALEAELAHCRAQDRGPKLDRATIRAELRARLAEWRDLLRTYAVEGQRLLRTLIDGRLNLTPVDRTYYRFEGVGTLAPVLAGLLPHVPHNMASPICASWNQMAGWLRAVEGLRRAA